MFHLFEHLLIVDINVFVRWVEEIAEHCHHAARLLIDELWALCRFLYLFYSVLPTLYKDFHFCVKLCHAFSLCYRAHDDAYILGLNAVDELLQSGTLLAAFDL